MLNKYGVFFGKKHSKLMHYYYYYYYYYERWKKWWPVSKKYLLFLKYFDINLNHKFLWLNMWPQIKTLYENIYFDLIILISQD